MASSMPSNCDSNVTRKANGGCKAKTESQEPPESQDWMFDLQVRDETLPFAYRFADSVTESGGRSAMKPTPHVAAA